jgi:hypothetical protein
MTMLTDRGQMRMLACSTPTRLEKSPLAHFMIA